LGTVEVKKPGGEWHGAKRGMSLGEDDSVRTQRDSKAVIKVKNVDETIEITLYEESEAFLLELLINSLTGKQNTRIELANGHMSSVTKKFDRGTSLRTETPNAVIELGKYGITVTYKEQEEQ
jgi:hypothetical protein